eukprot:m.79537 g.79537  ORF g.79537 m.79537 type:complete len:254 (+) comp16274_c0_seq2:147-908(+)
MRISADMIMLSPQFTNALKDREIDLRGKKIPTIENLGATLDQFDTYDFTNNEIRRLGGFPRLLRLKTLLLTNNKITRIAEDLAESVPALEEIHMKNNSLTELGDLEPLKSVKKLVRLSLIGNPVSHHPNYRLYVIHLLPALRQLDFQKIKDVERQQSKDLFSGPTGADLLKSIAEAAAKRKKTSSANGTAAVSETAAVSTSSDDGAKKLTAEEVQKIKVAIANAKTIEEFNALEAQLKAGTFGASGDAMQVDA